MESLLILHNKLQVKYGGHWDCNTTISRLTKQNLGDHIFSLVNFIMVVPLYGAYLTHDSFSRALIIKSTGTKSTEIHA